MDVSLVLVALIAVAVVYIWRRRARYSGLFRHIPGPKETWLLGNALDINATKFHEQLEEWSRKFGPIYKIRFPDSYLIIVSGYEERLELFHDTGLDLAGKHNSFRIFHHFKDTAFLNQHPDKKWKLLRKVGQTHLKQYGEGMKMETLLSEISEDMFFDFGKAADSMSTLDPMAIINRAAMKGIALIITGERMPDSHPLLDDLLQYEEYIWEACADVAPDYLLLDLFPPALMLPLRSSRKLKETNKIRDRIAEELKKLGLRHEHSLMKMLHKHMGDKEDGGNSSGSFLSEDDVLLTPIMVMFSGVGTSSVTFYCMVNILAHRKDIQERLLEEILSVSPHPQENVKLEDRPTMSYSRAVLYELLRYHTVVPYNAPRMAVTDTEIKGVRIPKGSPVSCDMWTLHHDPDFWEEPTQFRPERFLDGDGNLLPPEHPRRKHVLLFSSGPRNCLGEQFALARLFLWITNLVKRFEISPTPDNDVSKIDLKNFRLAFLLYPPKYEILLNRRSY